MKHDEKWGQKLTWAGIGLILAGILLGCMLKSPGVFGLDGVLYNIITAILCVIYVIAIYMVFRKFFGKKK